MGLSEFAPAALPGHCHAHETNQTFWVPSVAALFMSSDRTCHDGVVCRCSSYELRYSHHVLAESCPKFPLCFPRNPDSEKSDADRDLVFDPGNSFSSFCEVVVSRIKGETGYIQQLQLRNNSEAVKGEIVLLNTDDRRICRQCLAIKTQIMTETDQSTS
jgi:hypothetical protein